MAGQDSRASERVPASMRIKLRYEDVDTFIRRYAVNISRGGIFIATRSPKPVGTLVRFEFQLADATPVIRGEGQIIWIKPFDPQNPKRAHGMGVRFSRLDSESKALIDRALKWKEAHKDQRTEEYPSQESAEEQPEPGPGESARSPDRAQAQAPPPGSASSPVHSAQTAMSAEEAQEIVAELLQTSQSQIVRAARQIVETTTGMSYFPEDAELKELLAPLRIEVPRSGREAAQLLREMLDRGTRGAPVLGG